MGIALRLARQCQDNGLVKYWLKKKKKKVRETWTCELSPLKIEILLIRRKTSNKEDHLNPLFTEYNTNPLVTRLPLAFTFCR